MMLKSLIRTALLAACLSSSPLAFADVGALNRQVSQLYSQGKYREAIDVARQAVAEAEAEAEAEATLGADEYVATAISLNNLAALYQVMGRYDEALPLGRRALTLLEKTLGPVNANTARTLKNLAQLYRTMGRYDEALPLYRRVLAIDEKALGPDDPDTATDLADLAALYQATGRYDEALPLYWRTLAINEKAVGLEHTNTAMSLNNLAGLYETMGRYDEALPLYRRVLVIRERILGPEHADTVRSLSKLASLYLAMGRYDEALPLSQQALAILERLWGPEHAETAASLNNLAMLYKAVGRYDEALALCLRALAIYEKAHGPAHSGTAKSLSNLAGLYLTMARYDEALPRYRRALAILEKAQGPAHADTATILGNLAGLYRAMGHNDEALPLYQRALAIDERALGPDHPGTATSLNNLAGSYKAVGRYDEALPLYQRALVVFEKALGPEHVDTATSLGNLAGLYLSMGRYDEALLLFQRTLAIREKALGPEHADTASSMNNLAALYKAMGRYDAALPLYQRTLAILEKALGPEHADTAVSLNNLATLYKAMGLYDEALPLFQRALAIQQKARPEHADTAASLNNLAGLHELKGRYDEALPLFQRALAINEKALGPEHPNTATSLNNLGGLYRTMGRNDEALPLFRRAVRTVAVSDISDPQRGYGVIDELAVFSANLAYALQQRQDAGAPDEAIFYYKQAVNARQRQRASTRGLDKATRESFTQQVENPYRALADLLIQRGRIAEAERVLLLLKESDLGEYLRRNGVAGSQQQSLSWTAEEEAYRQDLGKVAAEWREFERRRLAVMDEVKRGRIAEIGPEVTALAAQRIQLDTRTTNVMADATRRFVGAGQKANARRLQAFDSARTELSTKLSELRERGDGGLRTAGLVLLPSERGLNLIITTEQGAVSLMRKVSEGELTALVKSLREAILARQDYREPAEALYQHLIGPAEAQLGDKSKIQHWAILPFGNLRALPFAALRRPDGTHLIEHYAVTMLTADGTGKLEGLETPPRDTWRGVALGASLADPEFDNIALPGVRREVCGVIRDQNGKDCRADEGLIGGQRYLDAAFTPDVLQHLLAPSSSGASFLHIATHFKVEKSLLLLGDGSKLSTGQILAWTPHLGQYDLIALSACDSGVSEGAVESLGGLFRSKGAKAVLATLWPVADVGAAPLMMEFYRERGEKRAMSKTAALQMAQRAMIEGRTKDESGKANLRLPYFWAPYVLMGNWL